MTQGNRSSGVIAKLPPSLKDTVEQMLINNSSYKEIVAFLSENQISLSQMSVSRYARRYLATAEQLRFSQENMQMILREVEKYPDLDVTEAILRLSGQNVLNAITDTNSDDWKKIDPEKLLGQATALIRAAGYKKRVDQQVKTDVEAALDANQTLLTDVLKKSHPELYRQVMDALRQEKQKVREEAP